jgi:hypothetical protein
MVDGQLVASTLKEIVMAATKNSSRCHSPAERLPNMPTG